MSLTSPSTSGEGQPDVAKDPTTACLQILRLLVGQFAQEPSGSKDGQQNGGKKRKLTPEDEDWALFSDSMANLT